MKLKFKNLFKLLLQLKVFEEQLDIKISRQEPVSALHASGPPFTRVVHTAQNTVLVALIPYL